MRAAAIAAVVLALFTGCAHKKPLKQYRFSGCQVTDTWVDRDGVTRKQCDCRNGREVGFDARTHAVIIRCE